MKQIILTEKFDYFSLQEYVDKIILDDNTLFRNEEISKEFDKYINKLSKYNPAAIFYFLVSSFESELNDSNLMEKHLISPIEINKHNVLYDNFNLTHKRIKDIHDFVTNGKIEYEYRQNDVRVSAFNKERTEETIFWYGAKPQDIKNFLEDYINIYKKNNPSTLHNNPFLKSALIHLLLVRIHPFSDGNGRTARMIHNMKLTEMINKIYGYKLKIAPLHISPSLYLHQFDYTRKIDNIHFGLDKDTNEELNRWFQFIINRYEDQLFYMNRSLSNNERALDNISNMNTSENDFYQDAITLSRKK